MTVRIINGHVLDALAALPAESVHCSVFSPPYYGLRRYDGCEDQIWGGDSACSHEWSKIGPAHHPGQVPDRKAVHRENAIGQNAGSGQFCRHCSAWLGSLGLEPTLDLYLDHMVEVMAAVWRVLRRDGCVFLNVGDSYCSTAPGTMGDVLRQSGIFSGVKDETAKARAKWRPKTPAGLKPKDLMLVPHRLAIRLQEAGWWVRNDITLAKRAPMPESVTDRCTSSHEHLLLLTKSARYFWDAVAVQEDASESTLKIHSSETVRPYGSGADWEQYHVGAGHSGLVNGDIRGGKRNMRDVWWLSPAPSSLEHYASFSPEIPRRAILAGTSEKGVCLQCKSPYVRIIEKGDANKETTRGRQAWAAVTGQRDSCGGLPHRETETLGWRPSCSCDAGDLVPATVLDPFLGSGTTALVADQLQRDCIGIELSPKYAAMARRRISSDAPLFYREAAE